MPTHYLSRSYFHHHFSLWHTFDGSISFSLHCNLHTKNTIIFHLRRSHDQTVGSDYVSEMCTTHRLTMSSIPHAHYAKLGFVSSLWSGNAENDLQQRSHSRYRNHENEISKSLTHGEISWRIDSLTLSCVHILGSVHTSSAWSELFCTAQVCIHFWTLSQEKQK